jgi:hypothetical protein
MNPIRRFIRQHIVAPDPDPQPSNLDIVEDRARGEVAPLQERFAQGIAAVEALLVESFAEKVERDLHALPAATLAAIVRGEQ